MITLDELGKIDVMGTYDRLYNAVDINAGLSIVEWIIQNTNLNAEPFSFRGYEYLIEPVNDLYPRQAIVKPAQKGASEAMARKLFAILYRYSLIPHYYMDNGEERCVWGINGIYSFPNTDDVRKFSKDRLVTDIINPSPLLRIAIKQSESEAVDQLGVYNSFCYLTGRRTDAGNQSIPAEIVFIDEFDRPLIGDRKVYSALNARTQNARIFGDATRKGLIVRYGTPTYPDESGALIEGQYFLSDQMTWMVKCSRCNEYQEILYPESIAHYYEKGEKKPDEDPYWICLHCRRPFDFTEIGKWDRREPHKVHNAEWVAKYPSKTQETDGIRGYRIPFATLKDTAQIILTRRDDDYRYSLQDFYNYGLGRAYRDNTISLAREDILRNTVDIPYGYYDSYYPHIMGVDQGCYIVIARLKEGSQTDRNPKGIWQVVWIDQTKDKEAFSKVIVEGEERNIFKGKLSELIDYWNIEVCVIDHQPSTAASDALANEYPDIVWLNDSKGNVLDRIKIEEKDEFDNIIHRMTENKHLALEQYFDEIRNHKFEYAQGAGEEFQTFIKHHINVKRVLEDNTARYVALGGADHYCQTGKYLSEAAEVYLIKNPRIKRAGYLDMAGFKEGR